MSLDVYLYEQTSDIPEEQCISCIAEEEDHSHKNTLYWRNLTHNLGRMAAEAGIYEACWRPEELMNKTLAGEIRVLEEEYFKAQSPATRPSYDRAQELREQLPRARARNIAPLLLEGLALLKREPDRFIALEPENKWGTYRGFVEFVEAYLQACMNNPDAWIEVSR
jgi:hypothetical protein